MEKLGLISMILDVGRVLRFKDSETLMKLSGPAVGASSGCERVGSMYADF